MITVKRAFDHIGMSVPDLEEAVDFFVDALGFEVVIKAGPFDDFGYVWPGELEPEPGTLRQANLVLGNSFNIELLEYTNRTATLPDAAPRPADPGGWHLCLHVDDIDKASDELASRLDTTQISDIIQEEQDMEGLRWAYFRTTWGLVLELIQWSPGMPYESTTQARMALPRWA
ncbi:MULTISPECIES: VOC family protein [Micrococcaceae]|uniref:VOC family protein n=1 Tax=Micrococcaceae TaxID=1268 RepID=UPI001035E18C|nr:MULTISPECIES: VOC family protein [Micrococcaceae]TAP28328.1 hypothetical protein EYR88_08520 [Arthrobacter sp. S41]UXN32873.1 VOC family protein [Glutamicibacter sp. M10]